MTIVTSCLLLFCSVERSWDSESHAMLEHLKNLAIGKKEGFEKGISYVKKNKGSKLIADLIDATKSPDENVRYGAIVALGVGLGKEASAALPALAHVVANEADEQWMRDIASNSMALVGPASMPFLKKLAKHRDAYVRRRVAMAALRQFDQPAADAIPLLLDLMSDPEERVRSAAVSGLVSYGNATLRHLNKTTKDSKSPEVIAITLRLDKENSRAREALRALVSSSDHVAQENGLRIAAGYFGYQYDYLEKLCELVLCEPEDEAVALIGTNSVQDERVVQEVLNCLDSTNAKVRLLAALSIIAIGINDRTEKEIVRRLNHKDKMVRGLLVAAIARSPKTLTRFSKEVREVIGKAEFPYAELSKFVKKRMRK
jgi:hypothetical protein